MSGFGTIGAPRPFMHWLGSPCYVSEFMRDSQVAIVDMRLGDMDRHTVPVHAVLASASGWGGLGAYNLARAYRPEGL